MVIRLFKVLLLIAILLIAWQFLAPRLRSHSSTAQKDGPVGEAEGDTAATCVEAVSQTHDAVVQALSEISWPKVNRARWDDVRPDLEGRIGAAQATCSCAEPACATGSEALQAIDSLVAEADGSINGGLTGMFNPATQEEHIQALLTKARAQAAGGF